MSVLGFTPLIINCQFLFAGETTFHQDRPPVCRMSAGKRRRKEPIQSPSDSEEGDDSIYDLNWEPEEGSVFKVYRCMSSTPPSHRYRNASRTPTTGRRSASLARCKGRSGPTRRRRACYTASSSTTAMRRHGTPGYMSGRTTAQDRT